jgi:hypothetical protein
MPEILEISQINMATQVAWGFPTQILSRAGTYVGFHAVCPLYLILTKIGMYRQILVKFHHIKFHGNSLSRFCFETCGQTDRVKQTDEFFKRLVANTLKMWIKIQVETDHIVSLHILRNRFVALFVKENGRLLFLSFYTEWRCIDFHRHRVDRATDAASNLLMIPLAQLCPEMGVDVPGGGQSHQVPRSMTCRTKGKYVVSRATFSQLLKLACC